MKLYEGMGRVKRINAEEDSESVYKQVVKSFEGYIWAEKVNVILKNI